MYEMILQALGGEPTAIQQDYAYIAACVLLILSCWTIVKIGDWLFRGWH